MASISCSSCAKYNYSIPDGTLETYEVDDGKFLPVERDEDMPPPCDQCPRGGPQNEERLTLGHRGYQAYALYSKLKATSGAYRLPEWLASCGLFAENMWLVERAVESGKAERMLRLSAPKK